MIELNELLRRLDGVERRADGQYMARCPCHDDKKASLAVRMGEKGIVLHCMTKMCRTEDILAAIGLTFRDLSDAPPPPRNKAAGKGKAAQAKAAQPPSVRVTTAVPEAAKPPAPPKTKKPADLSQLKVGGEYVHRGTDAEGKSILLREKITRCYDYQDKTGKAILTVFRTEAKSFPVIHLDGGQWYWGDGGHSELLYRLPKVLYAAKRGDWVWVVEGEKDVETLEGLGFVATCNKGGAGKWSDPLTAALEGARVCVCPDVDPPGRKHGQLVAKALAGHAKEVRLLNLRRAKGVELPEKGDVSDLCQQFDKRKANELLEQLLAASPVLSRRVSDEDYMEYFDGIPGCAVDNGCVYAYGRSDRVLLANFVALPVEEALVDDGNGDPGFRVKVAGWSSLGRQLPTVTMTMETFGRMDWPLNCWGLSANISESNGARAKLRRIVQAAGQRAAVRRTVFCHTGWREIGGKLCYLHGTGAIGAEDVDVQLEYGFERYSLDGLREGPWMTEPPEIRRTLCMNAALQAVSIATPRLGVPLVGYMFLCPLRHFLLKRGHRPSFIPFLRGQSQTGKSAFASLILNFYGYDWSFESSMPASFENTANAIGLKLFQLKDMPLLVDDYHPQGDIQKARQMAATAESVSRMIGDGAVRDRMRADGSAQTMKPVRALCIETGEETPRVSASSVGRMLVIDVRPGDVPIPKRGADAAYQERSDAYLKLSAQARMGALNEVTRGYIEWLTAQADTLPETLETHLDALRQEAIRRLPEDIGGRSVTAISYLMLGVQMMLEYFASPGGLLPPDIVPEMMSGYWDAAVASVENQRREMREESPAEIFLTTVRELLQSGKCQVQDCALKAQTPPAKDLIGYKDAQYYYLIPGLTFGAVNKALTDQGAPMQLTKNAVLRMLAQQDKLVKDARTGQNVRQYNRGGVRGWMIWLPRWVIDGTEPKMQEAQLTIVDNPAGNPFVSDPTKEEE